LLYLAYVAFSWGLADVYARPVINEIRKWQEGGRQFGEKDWVRLQTNLEKALALDPNNPDTNHFMAIALEGKYANLPPKTVDAEPARRAALNYYRKAIQLRPVWPHTWIDLALVKYRLGELDQDFYDAWHRGVELGPWEPGVQRVAAEIGLHGWNGFTKEDRMFTLEVIKRGVRHANRGHARSMLEQVGAYGYLELICLIVEDDEFVQDYCQRRLNK
jgi:tetratricopeptide (TPR) repeat protein